MDMMQYEVQQSNPPKRTFRDAVPTILACIWFAGAILIGIVMLFGVAAYHGERVSLLNFVSFITDITKVQAGSIYLLRFILGVLYPVYLIRIYRNIFIGIGSFRMALSKNRDFNNRVQSVLTLNDLFGRIFGATVMYMLIGRMLFRSAEIGYEWVLVLIGALVFLSAGFLMNYANNEHPSPYELLVDTARNIAMVAVLCMLFGLVAIPVVREINLTGLSIYTKEPLDIIYLILRNLILPLLKMAVIFIYASAVGQVARNYNYYETIYVYNRGDRRFRAIWIFGIVFLILHIIGGGYAAITHDTVLALLQNAKEPVQLFLLGITGYLLFKWKYPAQTVLGARTGSVEQLRLAMNTPTSQPVNREHPFHPTQYPQAADQWYAQPMEQAPQPVEMQYQQPMQNGQYQQPMQNGQYYQQPMQNGQYQQPMQNGQYYQQPVQNGQYQQPMQNGQYYQQPMQNGQYQQPMQNGQYQQPMQNGQYQQPMQNGQYYQQPTQGDMPTDGSAGAPDNRN